MRILTVLAAAAWLWTTTPALAQGEPPAAKPPEAQAGAYVARKEELARRYVRAIQSDRLLAQSVDDAMDAQIRSLEGRADPAVLQAYRDAVTELLPQVLPELERRMVQVMLKTLEEGELEALVRFWESPIGRSISEKRLKGRNYTQEEADKLAAFYAGDGRIMTPEKEAQITAATQAALAEFTPAWVAMVNEAVCKRITCRTAGAQAELAAPPALA